MFPDSGTPEHVIFVDSSLYAFWGVMGCQAYHLTLPDCLAGSNISFLELLNIYVALQFWSPQLAGTCVEVHCDTSAAVFTLTYFKAVSPDLCHVASKKCLVFTG